MSSTRLADAPDWGYLLREAHELYRESGAGGSARIRAHQRLVRASIQKVLRSDPPIRAPEAQGKPVTAHLRRALDRGRLDRTVTLIRAIDAVVGELAWLYGYDKVPRGLADRYAFAELAGPRGPIETEELILGLVLFAPGCTYPAHAHHDITESYYVLSGSVSENDDGVWAPGSLIFNPPGRLHRITVSDRDPSLLLYAWTGPAEQLRSQKMRFSRASRQG